MKALIVEDDSTSRIYLQTLLDEFGQCHIAVNGKEAVEAARSALAADEPYDLICLDIMMPEMDGQEALRRIRKMEEIRGILSSSGAKIVMVTALGDPKTVVSTFYGLCDAYLVKPIQKEKLIEVLKDLKLIE